ncbi:MAG TPA: hypothetical protein VL069_09455, partial [Opitutus sp.]|nr:hypothetical protein [Opitutus sp.]
SEPAPDEGGEVPEPTEEPTEETPAPAIPETTFLLVDEFTGTGALKLRVPDTMGPVGAAWQVQTGNPSLTGAGAVTANNTARAVIETGGADVEIVSTFNLGADGTGVIFRSSDKSNYLRFSLTRSIWYFQRTVAGVTTTVATGKATYPLKENYTLKVTLSGPTVVFSLNGVVERTITESFNQTATKHGLLCSNSGVRTWDSFSVRKL